MKIKSLVKIVVLLIVVAAVGLFLLARWRGGGPEPGTVLDEARGAGRTPASLQAADEDYFHDMDGGVPLTPNEVKGRNTWIVWTGGNDRFWDKISVNSFGALDLLKTVSSHPSLKYSRDNRWYYLGLVNEPCFEKPSGPDKEHFGLWLDRRVSSPECPPEPFENEAKYPGVRVGARGTQLPAGKDIPSDGKLPVGSLYGYASGVSGLRLFPNPAFDEKAAAKWDAKRYYEDPAYYNDKDLVKPYRVGMSCGFCHVGPNPIKPPADPEHPKWENLASNVGAQYFWIDRIFDWQADEATYIWQMFHTSRPGTLDTSLVSTDNINNPRTMNALYNLGPRLAQAQKFGRETLAMGGGSGDNKQFNDYPQTAALNGLFQRPSTVWSPRVLKDGADSVGGLGALNRVYLNIGLFSEEWMLHFNPLVGGKTVTPILIADARRNSSYWEATEMQTPDMALFFLKTTAPHYLKDAPDGAKYMNGGQPLDDGYNRKLERGKEVFAENCARCHSSKLPAHAEDRMKPDCAGPGYMKCWDDYWAWTKTDEFKREMTAIVKAPDFLDGNYLSTEFRVPVTLLQTNACSPLATNAIRGNIWDNFSSETYKDLPSVGTITIYDPVTGEARPYKMPGGGRGFTRPASLISLWSTAPFLLNNSVGPFNPDPSVAGRMDSFEKSIHQMLWPQDREKDSVLGDKVPGTIDRTTRISSIRIAPGFVPDALKGWGPWLLPNVFKQESIEIGPIPRGAPVGLLTNLMIRPEEMGFWERLKHDHELVGLAFDIKKKMGELGPPPPAGGDDEEYNRRAQDVFRPLAARLMSLSKCPDYVVNRGHYFGTGFGGEPGLSDDDKNALIEFLKTF
ncbi:MAG TPA: hypothetical protein VF538_19035 [Pyrinomonadaceae bacterium]|jgi:hypothetical protein